MSEEIKELIDTLEDCLKNPNLLDRAKAQRFYNGVSNLQQKVEQLEKENKRLNNIINELEKDINENIKVNDGSIICGLSSNSERKECRVENEAYYNILNKLKELKEDNKNV